MKIKSIKKYFSFTKAGILDGLAYKFSAIGWLLGDLVAVLILFYLWKAVYQNSPYEIINGMNFAQMVTYLIFARIVGVLVFSSYGFWIVGEDIYEGNIAISMTKPISYRYRILFTSFGAYVSALILMFIPLFIFSLVFLYLGLGITLPSIPMILLFLISSVLSTVIFDTLNFLFGQIAIFTNALFGLLLIKNTIFEFLAGSLLPIAFFPQWLQSIIIYLPFSSMIQTPVFILMGKYSIIKSLTYMLVQVIWIILLNLLASFSFSKLQKHIVSVGG